VEHLTVTPSKGNLLALLTIVRLTRKKLARDKRSSLFCATVNDEENKFYNFDRRRIARKLAHFVGVLNREDLNYHADSLREVAAKNRTIYRRLRKELEDLVSIL
jgi:hypothetical protein